jgi:hypothetical protein
MAKVAKLITFSLTTRVIVDENATDEEIAAKALSGIRAKIDNNELVENIESIEEDTTLPYGSLIQDASECPVCNRDKYVRPDYDSPDSMNCCDACGSEWVKEGVEITLDARDELSPEEIEKRGYNPM